MSDSAGEGWLESVRGLAKRLFGAAGPSTAESGSATTDQIPCCQGGGEVHVAYRGVSDDRMYIVYGKKWSEVKYFRPNGLRVFCAGCRRRLL